jgi:hypothetical protein
MQLLVMRIDYCLVSGKRGEVGVATGQSQVDRLPLLCTVEGSEKVGEISTENTLNRATIHLRHPVLVCLFDPIPSLSHHHFVIATN